MCYEVKSATWKKLKYARHRGDQDLVEELERQLEQLQLTMHYHASGFDHPELLAFTNDQPYTPFALSWGLIPGWVKDPKSAATISRQTLNARGETIWEKPSFRNAAKNRRCLIYLDGFYEYHHFGGKTYPFHILMKDETPMVVAGLWDEWVDRETGEVMKTASIVTTKGNSVMSKIHNNPKLEGPRMPLIFTREQQDEWLIPCSTDSDKAYLSSLIKPLDEDLLQVYTVRQLKGKNAVGNNPEAEKPYVYEELSLN